MDLQAEDIFGTHTTDSTGEKTKGEIPYFARISSNGKRGGLGKGVEELLSCVYA